MQINETPQYDDTENTTGCCPRFNPAGWDDQLLHFSNKLFVRATTLSIAHIPVNIGQVFARTFSRIEAAGAGPERQFLVLSRDLSPWKAEHLFAVAKRVPGSEMVELSGRFRTRVFEGPYSEQPHWIEQMEAVLAARGETAEEIYFFLTTCPGCARAYGRNPVVAFARLADPA